MAGLLGRRLAGLLGCWVARSLAMGGPIDLFAQIKSGRTVVRPLLSGTGERVALLLQIDFHLADGGLPVLFLGDLLELAAATGRDLADEAEVAALKLT